MSAMEDSLRRALEGGDTRDPAFRESIYAASERALERMLESRGADEASALDQRTRLAETINRVEADFAPHSYPADAQPDGFHEAEAEPYEPAPQTVALSETTAFSSTGGPTDDEPHEGAGWTPGGGRPAGEAPSSAFNWKVPALAVLLALGLALLAYAITGALRGGSSADPATTSAIQPSDGLPKLAWIDVFDGNDLESLSTPTGGRIEAVAKSDNREAVRISTPAGSRDEALLKIGPGIVQQIAGRQVRIEVVAGSPDGAMREFSVRCLVGQQNVCNDQRFSTDMPEEAFVFDVTVPAVASRDVNLAIAPGLGTSPSDVDLYSLRLRDLS